MGYDLRTPRSNVGKVLVFVASSDMHCAAFGAIDKHVVVAGSVTYFIHCLLQSRIHLWYYYGHSKSYSRSKGQFRGPLGVILTE